MKVTSDVFFFFLLMSDLHENRSNQHSTFDHNVAKGWEWGGVGWGGIGPKRGENRERKRGITKKRKKGTEGKGGFGRESKKKDKRKRSRTG